MRVMEALGDLEPKSTDDPEILIQGWGRLPLSMAKKRVSDQLKQAADRIVRGDFRSVQSMLFNGTLEAFVSAITRAESEINGEDQQDAREI